MTAEQIRELDIPNESYRKDIQRFQAEMLQEIAAQLAEFNERCAKNCTPPVSDDVLRRHGYDPDEIRRLSK